MRITRTWAVGLATAAALMGPSPVAAQVTMFHAFLNGTNEVPANASPGSGTASFTYDASTAMLSSVVTFSNLLAPTIAAHIHTGVAGANGPVLIGFPMFLTGVTSGTYTNTFLITPTQQAGLESQLAMGGSGLYVNVHTSMFPGGEIRGQVEMAVVPEPMTLLLVGSGLAGIAARTRRRTR